MPTDGKQLLAPFLAGDARAVAEVEAWIRHASRPFRWRLGEDWEDVVQEALLELTVALRQEKLKESGSLRGYVWRLVNHACIDRLRARRPQQWVDLDELQLAAPGRSPFGRLAEREAVEVLLEIFNRLPEACREVWRMIVEGKSYREMSRELGVADGTLRVRALRCRQKAAALRRGEESDEP